MSQARRVILNPALMFPRQAGTKLRQALHGVMDALPLPAQAKRAIKGCPGCGRRAEKLDRLTS